MDSNADNVRRIMFTLKRHCEEETLGTSVRVENRGKQYDVNLGEGKRDLYYLRDIKNTTKRGKNTLLKFKKTV